MDWYESWVLDHCRTFAITLPEWTAAFLSWRSALVGLGATEVELREATRRCLGDSPKPQFPADHLDAVQRHVGAQKSATRRRAAERQLDDGPGVCSYCGSTGWLAVPHPRFVIDGEWKPARYHEATGLPIHVTSAVTCTCPRGRQVHEATVTAQTDRGRAMPVSLEAYAADVNPAWREHLKEAEDAKAAMAKAQAAAAWLSPEAITRVVANAMRMPRPTKTQEPKA